MKEVRPQFTEEEHTRLREEAAQLGLSLRRLVHDRALGSAAKADPVSDAIALANEMSLYRAALNEIIRYEIETGSHLYEDDLIRLETTMAELEKLVSAHIGSVVRKGVV